MYWVTRLDHICDALTGLIVISIIAAVVSGIIGLVAAVADEDDYRKVKPHVLSVLKCAAIVVILAGTLRVAIPTSKEIAAIYLIPKMVNNEDMQQIPDNAAKLLNAKLKLWMDDTLEIEKKKKE
jgi:hypothetical protein